MLFWELARKSRQSPRQRRNECSPALKGRATFIPPLRGIRYARAFYLNSRLLPTIPEAVTMKLLPPALFLLMLFTAAVNSTGQTPASPPEKTCAADFNALE